MFACVYTDVYIWSHDSGVVILNLNYTIVLNDKHACIHAKIRSCIEHSMLIGMLFISVFISVYYFIAYFLAYFLINEKVKNSHVIEQTIDSIFRIETIALKTPKFFF